MASQQWWQEIERNIADCDCFLFAMTPTAIASEFCQKELALAHKLKKAIAPVLVRRMDIPADLAHLQVIDVAEGLTPRTTAKLLNDLFEIERRLNPLRRRASGEARDAKLDLSSLSFATTNSLKIGFYEYVFGVPLQTVPIELDDTQHVDTGEVALHKVRQAYKILHKPVFVDHAALSVRAWGGVPGGLTTSFLRPLGLVNFCKMMQPFTDKYAEAVAAIAFTDGRLERKFVGTLPGRIAETPRGKGWLWEAIFIPAGYDLTFAELPEEEQRSITMRRTAIESFMDFLKNTYDFE
jgi:XTP/dITP diphosphohydrolase